MAAVPKVLWYSHTEELARSMQPSFLRMIEEIREKKQHVGAIVVRLGPYRFRLNPDLLNPDIVQLEDLYSRGQSGLLHSFELTDDKGWERLLEFLETTAPLSAASYCIMLIQQTIKMGATQETLEKAVRQAVVHEVMKT